MKLTEVMDGVKVRSWDGAKQAEVSSLAYDALAKLAVKKARRKGDNLSDAELMELVQALFRTAQPGTCPRGRRTYVEWTDADLTRRFG